MKADHKRQTYREACSVLGLSPRKRLDPDTIREAYAKALNICHNSVVVALTIKDRNSANERLHAVHEAKGICLASASTAHPRRAKKAPSAGRPQSTATTLGFNGVRTVTGAVIALFKAFCNAAMTLISWSCQLVRWIPDAADELALHGIPRTVTILSIAAVILALINGCVQSINSIIGG